MKLIEFIETIKNINNWEQYLQTNLPGAKLDFIDLYIEKNCRLDSEIVCVNAENLAQSTSIINNTGYYINFCSLDLLLEIIVQYNIAYPNTNISNTEIVEKIMEYRINNII